MAKMDYKYRDTPDSKELLRCIAIKCKDELVPLFKKQDHLSSHEIERLSALMHMLLAIQKHVKLVPNKKVKEQTEATQEDIFGEK
jgi:hypothetical protein